MPVSGNRCFKAQLLLCSHSSCFKCFSTPLGCFLGRRLLVSRCSWYTVLKVEGRIMKRIRFLRWGSRISSTGSAVKLVSLKRQVPFGRRCESSFLMQLAARFRAQWKQAFGWKRSSAQCSYDPYSYSLNFDDGLSIP